MKWYVETGSEPEELEDFPKDIDPDVSGRTAEQLADWCHDHQDGWEWSWPKVFVIVDDAGERHHYSVERHAVPEFLAYEIVPVCPKCSTPELTVKHHRGECPK